MRAATIAANARERLQRPDTWGAAILIAGVWNLLRWVVWPGAGLVDWLLMPALVGGALALGAPLPWQWTGDDRTLAPFSRGLGQAALACLLVAWAALALLPESNVQPSLGPMPGHGMMRGPMGRGRGMMMHGQMGMGSPTSILPLPPMQVRRYVLVLALAISGALAGRILAVQEGERERADMAERRGREAQARALQAQMNPHVLFNAVSGLAELAHENPPAVESALVRFADLMRRLLEHTGYAVAPLTQERILVERLLDLEQFRLGDRLRVVWSWDAALEHVAVPPLLLQPLVENAIKHGIAPERAGGELEIGLGGTTRDLRIWVANTGRPFLEGSPEGTGLANLRQRLALMTSPPGQLEIGMVGGRTLAELHLRLVEAHHG